jgi:hypothetical protein
MENADYFRIESEIEKRYHMRLSNSFRSSFAIGFVGLCGIIFNGIYYSSSADLNALKKISQARQIVSLMESSIHEMQPNFPYVPTKLSDKVKEAFEQEGLEKKKEVYEIMKMEVRRLEQDETIK